MTIRPATHADVDGVLALWAIGRTAHATTDDRRVDVERVLDHAPGALLVAEEDGAVIGKADDAAVAFWTAAGYPQEPETVRHVRNL